MANYEAPAEIRPLEKMLKDFAYNNGKSISQVFDDWLYFIIGNFNMNPEPQQWWSYTKEQNMQFHKMFEEWIMLMERQIKRHEWFDVFGELYESCVVSKGTRDCNSQFFTPPSICDLMTVINTGDSKVTGKTVLDPTCGSGRTLLSFHAHHPGNKYFAEDIDRTCCLMTVANFIIHGIEGEVVWHNSLIPDSWNGGWHTNEYLNNPFSPFMGLPIPHMREIGREQSVIIWHWENRRREMEEQRQPTETIFLEPQQINFTYPTGKAVQLTLWD